MRKKLLSWVLIVSITLTSIISNNLLVYANQGETGYNYMLLSLSQTEPLVINANGGNIGGNIASNSHITIGNVNKNGAIIENVLEELPILFEAAYNKYAITSEDKRLSVDMENVTNINEDIASIGNVNIKGQSINGNNIAIISETGNVDIEANNVSLSGFIYAPYGHVKVSGDNVNLNGICIISNTIEISANNTNISGSQSIMDWVDECATYNAEEIYVIAIGEIVNDVVKITWLTNSINTNIKIYESKDNITYKKIADVYDAEAYDYSINEAFEVKYFKVSINGIDSVPFIVRNTSEGYKIELFDSDEDKIPDVLEGIAGTDIYSEDTDSDGLTDYEEVSYVKSNPCISDSIISGVCDGINDKDNDGIDNKLEVRNGTDPLSADTDSDGLNDKEEIIYNTDPLLEDTDQDGLVDGSEIVLKTDPLNPDSNGNGIQDGEELYEQVLKKECFEEGIFEENIAIPNIVITTQGDVNRKAICTEYIGHLKRDGREIVGKDIEISGSEAVTGKITFTLDTDYTIPTYTYSDFNTNGLLICKIVNETTIPLATAYNEETRELSAEITSDGIYFVMDVVTWLESLGININEVVEDMDAIANTPSVLAMEGMSSYSLRSADKNSINSVDISIAGKPVSGQVDIVFVVDTTGSMGLCIANVRDNIERFADEISKANIKANFALVEYRDMTYDDKNYTNAKINKENHTCWFNTASSLANALSALKVYGGGDIPETAIDGLEFARQLNLRENSQKFFVLVTDADYKSDNNYGIKNMNEMISLLVNDNINTSVVTGSDFEYVYRNLYETTGGIYANIYENFEEELLSIANKIIEVTNDGSWIILNGDGAGAVKLDAKPTLGSLVDTDKDGITDVEELGSVVPTMKYNAVEYVGLLKYYNSPFNIPTLPGWDIYIYNYNTNPVKEDTDNDGLLDGRAIVETVDGKEVIVAPKDYNPKDYDGPKNIWKTHIRSVKSGNKFAHSYSDDYFEPVKFEGSIKFYGIIPYLDSNLIEWASSKISSFGSKFCDFRYDDKHIALHSDEWQWQALAGYNNFYDVVFDTFTSMNRKKFPFESGDKEYIIWAWKGNYINLGPGSEVGFYDDNTWGIGQWYVSDSLDMTCSLYKKVGDGSIYTTLYNWYPDEQQWWITGFVPDIYDYSSVDENELVQVSSVKLGEQKYKDFYDEWYGETDSIIFDDERNMLWLIW